MLSEPLVLALLGFVVLNLVARAPGTAGVRYVSIAVALAALPAGNVAWTGVLLTAFLVWPAAFAIALSRASGRSSEPAGRTEQSWQGRITLAAIIAAAALASATFGLLGRGGLQQSAALFIGIPSLLAIVVTLAVTPRSATGVAVKATTVALLVSLLFLGEGVLCIVMSAPLFLLIAVLVGRIAEWYDHERAGRSRGILSCVLVLAVGPMSLEGVTPATSFPRHDIVTVSRVVPATPDAVERALIAAPRFDRGLPHLLRLGFPRPVAARLDTRTDGTAAAAPATWIITFRGGETRLDGQEPAPGDLVLRLAELDHGRARWMAVSDSSHVTHFLDWSESIVEWTPAPGGTRVTWTIRYRRGLDPAWYFAPMQRYAVRLAAGYLIESVATP